MKKENYILEELTSIECNLPYNVNMPYAVPTNYFEQNKSLLLEKAQIGIAKKVNVYTVPATYFSSVATSVLEKIALENELQNIAPTLAGLAKNNVFSLPNNYFTTTIKPQLVQTKPAKIIAIKWRLHTFIAAACCIAILFLSSIWFMQQNNKPLNNLPLALQQVSENEMMQYIANDHTALATEVNIIEDLENNSKTKQSTPELTEEALNDFLNSNKENKEG